MNTLFFKIIVLITVFALLCVLLKNYRPEYSFLLTLAVVITIAVTLIKSVFPYVRTLISLYKDACGNQNGISTVLKVIVIGYIANFCSDLCRDYGQTALAEKTELAGKCTIFIITVPLIISVIEASLKFSRL